MPPTFTEINDARQYFEQILRRVFRFIREARRVANFAKRVLLVSFSDEDAPLSADSTEVPELPRISPDELEERQRIHYTEMRHWDDAFQQIYRHIMKSMSESHPDLLCATLLKIRSTTLLIRLAGAISDSELIYDQYLPDFQKIISLAGPLAENLQNFTQGSFCFDQGFIYELVFVALNCRDRALRREAIKLLESKDWREGTWGSRIVADSARNVVEVEEEGVKTERIPESARARLARIDVDVEGRLAHIHCVRGVGADAVLKSSVRYWSSFS